MLASLYAVGAVKDCVREGAVQSFAAEAAKGH